MEEDAQKEAIQEGIKEIINHLSSMENKIDEKVAKEKLLLQKSEEFEDSLEELINMSGDISNKDNLRVILNALLNKLCELSFKHILHSIHFINGTAEYIENYFDHHLAKLARDWPKEEKSDED